MNNTRTWQPDEIVPKPFDFVPFAPVARADTVGHERVRGDDFISGVLELEWEALSHIAVSSGSYVLFEELGNREPGLIMGLYRVGNIPTIPGSTLKGVVRSIVEAATASCITTTRVERRWLPIPDSSTRDGCTPAHACPACSMFGRMNRMSKIRFGDAQPDEPIRTLGWRVKPLHNPHANDAPPVYRTDNGHGQYKGRKFYRHGRMATSETDAPIEAMPRQTRLTSKVWFTNLAPHEMGALCFGLGLDGTIALKLGGHKPRCLGSLGSGMIALRLADATDFTRSDAHASKIEGEPAKDWVQMSIQHAVKHSFLHGAQVDSLREILNYQDRAACPPEMY